MSWYHERKCEMFLSLTESSVAHHPPDFFDLQSPDLQYFLHFTNNDLRRRKADSNRDMENSLPSRIKVGGTVLEDFADDGDSRVDGI